MTRLYINGEEVALPESFELDFITENPYFTRNGEYTYDLDIDLRNPMNRQIYSHINRWDVTNKLTGRKAELIAGDRVIIRGLEIILSVDVNSVKIQIVSGNSQLNYDGTRNIRDIEFDQDNAESVIESFTGSYPQYKAVYTPVIYHSNNRNSPKNKVATNGTTLVMQSENPIPQYFLLYVLENLLLKIGFRKKNNDLESSSLWSRVFVVNSIENTKLQDILPDWTVNEFFEQVELFMNCIIRIDELSGTYDIVDAGHYFDTNRIIYIDDCTDDDTEKKYGMDTNYAFAYQYVSYDFPNRDFYNYIRLKDGIKDVCMEILASSFQGFDRSNFERYYSGAFILRSMDNNLNYVITQYKTGSLTDVLGLTIVDRFKDAGDPNSQNRAEFRIVPSEVEYVDIWDIKSGLSVIAPAVRQMIGLSDKDEENKINNLIKNGISRSEIPDRICVGIYYGLCKGAFETSSTNPNHPGNLVPISAIDYYNIGYPDAFTKNQQMLDLPHYTLALEGDDGLFNTVYRNKRQIDTTVEYQFRFVVQDVFSLNNIFCIRNKMYYCKQIKYKINQNGIDRIAEGIFYLVESGDA